MTIKSSDAEPAPCRPLGPLEEYSAARSHLGMYLNVALTVRYKRRSGAAVKLALFRALSTLISKHPILAAVPMAVDTQAPFFSRLPSITLSEVVTFVEDHDTHPWSSDGGNLDDVLEDQHSRPFLTLPKQNPPFWRICVLESAESVSHFTVVLVFHHSLMDTKSALSFHEELEVHMNQASCSEPVDIVYTSPTTLLPPLEDLCALPVSAEFMKTYEKHDEPPHNRWTAKLISAPVKTRFTSLWLCAAETAALSTMCSKEQTSVTATLQTLIAAGLFSVLPLTYSTLQADCAVSLRRFLPEAITATSLGCYVGSQSTVYQRMLSFTWDEARRTKEGIERAIKAEGGDMPVGYLRVIPNLHFRLLQNLGQRRMAAFELSNIQRSSPPQEVDRGLRLRAFCLARAPAPAVLRSRSVL